MGRGKELGRGLLGHIGLEAGVCLWAMPETDPVGEGTLDAHGPDQECG